MPKEIIHDDRLVEPQQDGEPYNSTPFAVDVSWGRDTSVQIGSINLQREPYTEERGWFVTLDRGLTNQLIRVLRKARDQAYGADE